MFPGKIFRVILFAACCGMAADSLAQGTAPSCTVADVTGLLSEDPSCSIKNVVVFGPNIVDFVTSQCTPFSVKGGNAAPKAKKMCVRCAKDAWSAFTAASKAKLITARLRKESPGLLKRLCGITTGDEEDSAFDSDALKILYGQLRLCLPVEGHPVDMTQCNSCALTVLGAALENNVINKSRYDVMKTSIQAACSVSDNNPPKKTPVPTPTPAQEENSLKKYGQGLRTCFETFAQDSNRNVQECLSCVNSVDPTGLDLNAVNQYLSYARSYCYGTYAPSTPTPTPTPVNTGNSFTKLGQGINSCIQLNTVDGHMNSAGCLTCLNGLDTSGLDPNYVTQYMNYAIARCNETSI